MDYGAYLRLDRVLSAQEPLSDAHDEMLFIVIHQASELWMKLCLHEIEAAQALVAADALRPAFKNLARVARIQQTMIQSWEILATMTPSDYARIRPHLGTSSGFQSHQYRLIEFALGQKKAAMVGHHAENAEVHERLLAALHRPSFYDEALRLLARRGFAIPPDRVERDWSVPTAPSSDVEAAWIAIYREPDRHFDLYELAEKLVDLEYRLQQWRFAHMTTVERIIGTKRGTGGSAGVPYLRAVIEQRFFPELMAVRTEL